MRTLAPATSTFQSSLDKLREKAISQTDRPAADWQQSLDAVKPKSKITTNEVRTRNRATRESAEVPEPIRASTTPQAGTETKIRVPGEGRTYKAAYQVRELDDVHPSHSSENFTAKQNTRLRATKITLTSLYKALQDLRARASPAVAFPSPIGEILHGELQHNGS